MGPQILHAARELCKVDAQKLQIKIQPFTVARPRVTHSRTMARESTAHLREVASSVEDEELKEILLNIANQGD